MEILKYEKKGNGNYLIYFSLGKRLEINEEVILKHKLLYKKEIDDELLDKIIKDNNDYDIYNKCVSYIGIRLRSVFEIKEYMKRKGVSQELSSKVVEKLISNKLLDDRVYTRAFINDKLKFTTMGPNRIRMELERQKIDRDIINEYIYDIDEDLINEKNNKQIDKIIKSNKNKKNLKNKIYTNLTNLGYTYDMIMNNLNNYDL